MEKTQYLPKGYHNVIASLSFNDTHRAISWYKNIYGAEERLKINGPDEKIMHAEMSIGDSLIFLAEENPQYDAISPGMTNGNSIKLHLYVEDVDNIIKKAVQNGAKLVMPPMDMFYGDRVANIEDPFGYSWVIATHVKDVSETEIHEKAETFETALSGE